MTPFDRALKDLLRTANVEDLAVMLIEGATRDAKGKSIMIGLVPEEATLSNVRILLPPDKSEDPASWPTKRSRR